MRFLHHISAQKNMQRWQRKFGFLFLKYYNLTMFLKKSSNKFQNPPKVRSSAAVKLPRYPVLRLFVANVAMI